VSEVTRPGAEGPKVDDLGAVRLRDSGHSHRVWVHRQAEGKRARLAPG